MSRCWSMNSRRVSTLLYNIFIGFMLCSGMDWAFMVCVVGFGVLVG